ncbi:hypothetical protein [Paramagnetospirillum marisnigri]|nr:hypothetical protein [Paramagnetospirillum marisnigri]
MKIHVFIAAAALAASLTGCVIDPAYMSGFYGGQSYGYQAPAY